MYRLSLKYHTNKDKGFTLIETLVAITVLMIAIAGPLTVAEKGLYAAIYAKNQLMASYLAQDALESMKNAVDTNELQSATAWLNVDNVDLSSNCNSANNQQCTIDTINGRVTPCVTSCDSSSYNPLNLTSNGYSYSSGGSASNFSRTFSIQTFPVNGIADAAADVTVNVTWPGDVGGGGGVELEYTLYNNAPR